MPSAKELLPSSVEQVKDTSSGVGGGSRDSFRGKPPHPGHRAMHTVGPSVSSSVWRPRAGLWSQIVWVESQPSCLWAVWPTASDLTFLGPNFLIGTMRAEIVLTSQKLYLLRVKERVAGRHPVWVSAFVFILPVMQSRGRARHRASPRGQSRGQNTVPSPAEFPG